MRQTSKIFGSMVCILCTSIAAAQDHQPPSSNSWQPPAIQYNSPQSNAPPPPRVADVDTWWPTEPENRKAVRAANHEVAVPNVDRSVDQSLQQAGEMFTNLQDSASNKMSGLMGSLETEGGVGKTLKDKFAGVDVTKMFGSLAIVLGGYFGFVWLVRRFNSGTPSKLPSEVLELIGNAPFGPRKNLQLVRLGTKLLLLINGPEGTHPIGEITDPAEVEHLASLCLRRGRTKSNGVGNAAVNKLLGRAQSGMPQSTAQPIAEPVQQMSQPAAVQTPSANTASELEKIIQRLSNVVQQSNRRNVFEA